MIVWHGISSDKEIILALILFVYLSIFCKLNKATLRKLRTNFHDISEEWHNEQESRLNLLKPTVDGNILHWRAFRIKSSSVRE